MGLMCRSGLYSIIAIWAQNTWTGPCLFIFISVLKELAVLCMVNYFFWKLNILFVTYTYGTIAVLTMQVL